MRGVLSIRGGVLSIRDGVPSPAVTGQSATETAPFPPESRLSRAATGRSPPVTAFREIAVDFSERCSAPARPSHALFPADSGLLHPALRPKLRDVAAKGCDFATKGCDSDAKGCDFVAKGCDSVAKGCDSVAKGCDFVAKECDFIAKVLGLRRLVSTFPAEAC